MIKSFESQDASLTPWAGYQRTNATPSPRFGLVENMGELTGNLPFMNVYM